MRKGIEKTYLILHGGESREQNKTKHALRYKTRTEYYELGIKYGRGYKTRTEHYRLGIKHEERYKIPISYQVIKASREWYFGDINVTW